MNNAIIIKNIKRWLTENGRTQKWLANETKISCSMISQAFGGSRRLQTKHLLSISKAMDLPVSDLVRDKDSYSDNGLSYELRGTLNKKSKQKFDRLLWDIKRYVDLEEANYE